MCGQTQKQQTPRGHVEVLRAEKETPATVLCCTVELWIRSRVTEDVGASMVHVVGDDNSEEEVGGVEGHSYTRMRTDVTDGMFISVAV